MEGQLTTAVHTQAATSSRFMQLAMAGLLGVFVIGLVGFSHLDVAHNAAHDYRHSMAFPCH
jgi:cobalt transporter subunit CbtB